MNQYLSNALKEIKGFGVGESALPKVIDIENAEDGTSFPITLLDGKTISLIKNSEISYTIV